MAVAQGCVRQVVNHRVQDRERDERNRLRVPCKKQQGNSGEGPDREQSVDHEDGANQSRIGPFEVVPRMLRSEPGRGDAAGGEPGE